MGGISFDLSMVSFIVVLFALLVVLALLAFFAPKTSSLAPAEPRPRSKSSPRKAALDEEAVLSEILLSERSYVYELQEHNADESLVECSLALCATVESLQRGERLQAGAFSMWVRSLEAPFAAFLSLREALVPALVALALRRLTISYAALFCKLRDVSQDASLSLDLDDATSALKRLCIKLDHAQHQPLGNSAQLADKVAKIQALLPTAVPRLTVESFIGYEVHASGKAFVAYQHGLVVLKRGGLRKKWRFAEFVPLSKMSVSERGDIRVACKGAALIFSEPQMRRLLLQLPLPSCGSSQALDHEVSRLSILMRFNRFRSRSHSSPPTSEETPRKETLDLDDEEESTMAEWAVTTNCDLEDTDDDDDGDSSSSHNISTSELVSELVRLSSHTDLKRFDNDLVSYSPVRVM